MFRYLFLFLFTLSLPLLAASPDNKNIIAFAQDTMANDFRKSQVYEVRDEIAKHPQLSFIYSDGKGQTSLMIRQIEGFIKQKVDLLILGTNDERAIVPVVSKAYKAGIPVILLDRGILSNNYTTFIKYDNRKIGQIAGQFIANKLKGKGQVLLLEGVLNTDVTKLRSKGFFDKINKYKNIRVIKRTGNFLRKDTIVEMEKLIKQGIHVDAIFAESDSMLSGVRLVLNRYKINPKSIHMVGVDFISEAQQAIRNGSQLATVTYPLGGKKAVELALKILKGKQVPKQVSVSSELVTKSNVNKLTPIF
ncbi:MAG: substrate-binding domain-containing protein [Gammaproteobacteria bacterium]|nr:substrate-binding domain-containing protein [Gammaproteobacteria bacterium]